MNEEEAEALMRSVALSLETIATTLSQILILLEDVAERELALEEDD